MGQKWWDSIFRSYCRLKRNRHLYDTEAFQATWNSTSGRTNHHTPHGWRSGATCEGQPEDADHSAVLGPTHTSRQIRYTRHANAGVQSSTWVTMVPQTQSWHRLGSIDSLQPPSVCGAEEMTLRTAAVTSQVSEAENEKLLGCGLDIWTLRATEWDDLLPSIEVVVAFPHHIGECTGLLGATLKDITLDSWENTDPSAGHDEQVAAVVVGAEEPLQGDMWMTAAGSPRSEVSDWMAGIHCFAGEPLITRPPGYSLLPLPSFVLIPVANRDGAVQRYSRQTNDNWQRRVHFAMLKSYEVFGSLGMR